MNQIAEDMEQDDEIGNRVERVEEVAARLKRSELVRPAYSFKGAELFPFTYGYEILFNQVRDAEDTGLYTWMAFIYLLRSRKEETNVEHRKWAISIAWKVSDFRESLIAWMDEIGPFSTEDKIEAKRIYEETMKAAADTTVEVVPDRKRPQKKTVHQKKQSSSTSSEGN